MNRSPAPSAEAPSAPPGGPPPEPRLWPWTLALLAAAGARIAVAAAHPLYETETYYWQWSRHLDFGYFDHPPMLGWFVWLTDWFGPPHSLAARLHCGIGHFLITILTYLLARNLFGSRLLGIRAALVFNVVPVFGLLATQNQPDGPMILFWMATLVCVERATATRKPGWWLLAGAAAGGALLSKFHAVILVGGIFPFLLFTRETRRHLATPWPWLALAIAAACYTPNVLWNANHDWLTYDFQFVRNAEDPEFSPLHVLAVMGGPFLFLSPWIAGVMYLAGARSFTRGALRGDRARALLFWASAPLFLLFVALGFTRNIKIHWPVPAFVALCPAVALLMDRWRRPVRAAFLVTGASLSCLIYFFLLSPQTFSLALPGSLAPDFIRLAEDDRLDEDKTSKTFGWDVLAEALVREVRRSDLEAPTLIMSRRFDRAAAAAFHAGMPERAWVHHEGQLYRPSSRRPDPRGFMAWDNPLARPGANAIYVVVNGRPKREADEIEFLKTLFEEVSEPIILDVEYEGFVWRRWKYMRCRGYRGAASGR